MTKPTPAQRRAATNALDAWVLGIAAKVARDSTPRGNAALSAFLSEIAGSKFLSSMEKYAKVVRVKPWRAEPAKR